MTFGSKGEAVDRIKQDIEKRTESLHPGDKAEAFREIQGHAVERACEQERLNTQYGVPERRPTPAELDDDGDFI